MEGEKALLFAGGHLREGDHVKTEVQFRSDRFPAYESELHAINPTRYGKRLAEFVAGGLRLHGFGVGELLAEDWGWVVPIENEEFKLWVGCGRHDEYHDGFLCFIKPDRPVIRKMFRRIETRARVEAVQKAIDAVLTESAGIREKIWLDA
jgi:hypothetical protein